MLKYAKASMVYEIRQNTFLRSHYKDHTLNGCLYNQHGQKTSYLSKEFNLDARLTLSVIWKRYQNFDFSQNLKGIFGVIHHFIRSGIPYRHFHRVLHRNLFSETRNDLHMQHPPSQNAWVYELAINYQALSPRSYLSPVIRYPQIENMNFVELINSNECYNYHWHATLKYKCLCVSSDLKYIDNVWYDCALWKSEKYLTKDILIYKYSVFLVRYLNVL